VSRTRVLSGGAPVEASLLRETSELRREGRALRWCWDTAQYEFVEDFEAATIAARAAAKKAAERRAAVEARETAKALMGAFQRSKADQLDAVEAERVAAEEERAAAVKATEAASLRKLQEADPEWQTRNQYRLQLEAGVGRAIREGVYAFIDMVVELGDC